MAYAAVTSLHNTITNFKDSKCFLLLPQFHQLINPAYEELKSLQQILRILDATSKGRSRKKVNELDSQIKEAVWKFEDLLESHVYPQILDRSYLAFVKLGEHLRHDIVSFAGMLKEKTAEYVSELADLAREDGEAPSGTDTTATQTADSGVEKPKMVGSSDPLWRRIKLKLDSSNPHSVVSVVGMAGIGKTTITREVFDDPLLLTELEFERRAWVSVGRRRRLDRIKRDIVAQLEPSSTSSGGKNVGHLLKKALKAKRSFVVLDDVWDTSVWEELKSCLPYNGRGRNLFLLTTRLRHVAVAADQSMRSVQYAVELLDKDESWDLLRQRVFGEEEDYSEFNKSGKKIAEKCDGLPLMIVAVAALLKEAEMTAEFWEKVARSKKHPIFTAAYDQLYEVLLPSYEYLPQHLKPCFLHMGVFPQNHETARTKLFAMWIAEGFLDMEPGRKIEDFLSELVDHSVAIICQRNSGHAYNDRDRDDVKTVRLQSSFWHLCSREAVKDKFFSILSSRDEGLEETGMTGQRRLSFHNNILFTMKDVVDSVEEACASSARALLCYGPYNPYPVPVCFGLTMLKLLDAIHIRFYEFPAEQVVQLVYLKYLALTCNSEIPPSISKLLNLRFLIIHRNESIRICGELSYVPMEVWRMRELQRIEIKGRNMPNPTDEGPCLKKLLKLVGVGAETCTREVLEKIPNLKKLGIQIESLPADDVGRKVLDCLNNVYLLRELTSLKCVVMNPTLTRNVVTAPLSTFPSGLKKLYLCGLGLPWERMSVIGDLRNLEVLKLERYAFRGPEWVVRYGEFRALKSLVINGTDLVYLKVEDRVFMSLEMLCFVDCYRLKRLRWELMDLLWSVRIILIDCGTSAATCAEELALKYDPDRVRVFARSSWLDRKSK